MPRKLADQVIVIGGGLAGVCTLYELAADGIPATLLEAEPELACGASFANGGLLVPGLADPWNSPGVHKHLLSALFDPASSMQIRWRALPGLAPWGVKFLLSSRAGIFRQATIAGYLLSRYSVDRTLLLADSLGLDCDAKTAGCLKLFAHPSEMRDPLKVCEMLQAHGSRWEVLDTQGVLALEPSLIRAAGNISGGIYYPDEASGDARSFTLSLADRARSLGARIRTGARVSRIVMEQGCATGVIVNGENLDGEVVLAAGIDSPRLSRRLGLRLAIKPAKGYSLTMDTSGAAEEGPKIPIMDQHGHVGIVPLGQRLRLVGTAEFAGRDDSIPQARIDKLFSVFRRLFPHLADRLDSSAALAWAGLRPVSPDGMPYIGATATPGLWVNSGHGSMGWSMAPGSARLLVDLMQGRDPAIDPSPFSVRR